MGDRLRAALEPSLQLPEDDGGHENGLSRGHPVEHAAGFEQAHHARVLQFDARDLGLALNHRLGQARDQVQLAVDIDHGAWGNGPVWVFDENGQVQTRIMTDYARHHALLDRAQQQPLGIRQRAALKK